MLQISIFIIVIGFLGIIRSKDRFIVSLIFIEILTIGIIIRLLDLSLSYDDLTLMLFVSFILVLSAVEAALGLSILINSRFSMTNKEISIKI